MHISEYYISLSIAEWSAIFREFILFIQDDISNNI